MLLYHCSEWIQQVKRFTSNKRFDYLLGLGLFFLIWQLIALAIGQRTMVFPGPVETIKYMASAIDHICNIAEGEEEGYSGRYPYWMGGAYADGNMGGNGRSNRSMRGGRPYRRGYSREGYSRDGGMVEELRELMQDAPDERTKQEFQRFIDKIERM